MGQPSALITGMWVPQTNGRNAARSPLVAGRAAANWKAIDGLRGKRFPRGPPNLYTGPKHGVRANGDDHERAGATPRKPGTGLGEAQRSRGAQELHPRLGATRQ